MSDLTLDALGDADVPALMELTRQVQWIYTEADIATLVAAGRFFGHRTAAGGLASSAALFPYGDDLASIGMVIVSPDWQRRGLGRTVTEKCLDEWPYADRPVMLIATPQGEPLYRRLGFETVEHVHRMMGRSPWQLVGDPTNGVRPMEPEDHAAIRRVDRDAIGAGRDSVLSAKIAQAKKGAVIRRGDGSVVGYGLRVDQPEQLIIGPIIAPDQDRAAALVDFLCADHHGPVRIDVPEAQVGFRSGLEARGFEQAARPPMMLRGGTSLPGDRRRWFAVAGQAFG